MSNKYTVKMKDEIIEEPKYIMRRVELKVGTSITIDRNMKIPRTSLKDQDLKLNEVYLEIDVEKIKRIDMDNKERDKFISYINKKMNKNKVNVVITNISFYERPSPELLDEVLEFFLDVIHSNLYTSLLTPPRLAIINRHNGENILDAEASSKYFERFLRLLIDQNIHSKPLYLIPSYSSRRIIPNLIKLYINTFGSDGLFVVDMNGGRFTYGGYSVVAQIMRIMEKMYRQEDYGIYLFNHKPRKRSGKEVPSEDLIAILNGVNFIGGLHGNIPLPPRIVSELEKKPLEGAKILCDEDFLYYPYDKAPNKEDFYSFLISRVGVEIRNVKHIYVNLYNDVKTNDIIHQEFVDNDTIRNKLISLRRDDFKKELEMSAKKIFNVLKTRPLSSMF